jgi:hypothetical protein
MSSNMVEELKKYFENTSDEQIQKDWEKSAIFEQGPTFEEYSTYLKNIIMPRKIQVLVCKCGAKYAACVEPYCYTDKDWLKDLKKHIKEGGTVEMSDSESFTIEKCKCNDQNVSNEPNLFS